MNKIFVIFFLNFIALSCSTYVEKLHSQIDAAMDKETISQSGRDKFSRFRNKSPLSGLRNKLSTQKIKQLKTPVKRQYNQSASQKKRYKAGDLLDKDNSSSLWIGNGNDGFFFTSDSRKKQGDIIIIHIMGKLKDDITAELKRSFPESLRKKKKEKKAAPEKEVAPQAKKTAEKNSNPSKIYDKVSSVIIEEINKAHVLLSGRKSILFKNGKHLIEIQALINRKSITLDDVVPSDNILESSIKVLR